MTCKSISGPKGKHKEWDILPGGFAWGDCMTLSMGVLCRKRHLNLKMPGCDLYQTVQTDRQPGKMLVFQNNITLIVWIWLLWNYSESFAGICEYPRGKGQEETLNLKWILLHRYQRN